MNSIMPVIKIMQRYIDKGKFMNLYQLSTLEFNILHIQINLKLITLYCEENEKPKMKLTNLQIPDEIGQLP